jgi:hypothetical protein
MKKKETITVSRLSNDVEVNFAMISSRPTPYAKGK